MRSYIFLLIPFAMSLIFFSSSCKKSWLEAKAIKTQSTPSTFKDLQGLMDLSFRMNNYGIPLGEISSDGHFITESTWNNASSNNARNAYTWSHANQYLNLFSWEVTYNRILYANIVLEGLKKITPSNPNNQTTWNDIKGQALFNRAEAFFWLSQLFAPPYNRNTSAVDLGIPLRLNTDVSEPSTRSSLQQTYDQIINDLKEAKNLVPTIPLFPTRAGQPAVNGLLARVYLGMQHYDSALVYADYSLGLYNNLLDYNQPLASSTYIGTFNSNPANTEILFHIRMYTSEISGFITSNCLIDTAFYNQYSNDDLRKTKLFKLNSNETVSFIGNYFNNSTDLFCGLATDEVLLIRAECYARKGNKDAAITDLKTLMVKRWKNTVPFPIINATDADDALIQILQERKKELVLRGLRWYDLRRLNLDNRFKTTLTRTIGGQTYILEPNSYKYTFPIPDDIILISGMQQNVGW